LRRARLAWNIALSASPRRLPKPGEAPISLEFSAAAPPPARVVLIGIKGFIGGALAARLSAAKVPVLGLGRPDFDLLAADAGDRLAALLRPDDALVMVSAKAPCRDETMLLENLRMAAAVAAALRAAPVRHVTYVSSDAVYGDSMQPLSETDPAAPESIHGVMHLARELTLRQIVPGDRLAVLRPTLVYGAKDPHNGYGPNRFMRSALAGETIRLFGEGEERRDHVSVDDVAEVAVRTIMVRGAGTLNLASGEVVSFRTLAEACSAFRTGVAVQGSPRSGPMPHGGFRPISIDACRAAFPDFRPTRWQEGLARMHQQLSSGGKP
jgi:UDP-glucose 4-epimerase